MKKSVLEGNLQILLRSQQKEKDGKKPRKQNALSCFFDREPCEEMYPEVVECKRTGVWNLKDKGHELQPDRRYKVWAVYSRNLPNDKEVEEDVVTGSECSSSE